PRLAGARPSARRGSGTTHRLRDRPRRRARDVCATGEELLVAVELLRPVPSERREEMLAYAGPQMDDARPDRARSGRACPADDLFQKLGSIRKAREDRRDGDADVDPRGGESAD